MIRALGAPILLLPVAGCGSGVPPVPVRTAAAVVAVQRTPCAYRDPKAAALARAKLDRDLAHYLARRPGRVSAMAKDLASGATVGYHQGSHQQITASGAKVDILVTMLRQARAQHRGLSGTERALATNMITHSDNHAADALYRRIGQGSGMSSTYRRLGLRGTSPGPAHYWGGTTTSPYDRVRLISLLAKGGSGLHPDDRAYALGLMQRVEKEQRWGVSAAARATDKVALKNGWTPRPFIHNTWAVTSYGRILGPGRDYALSVQTDVQPGMESGVATIEAIGRLIDRRMAALNPIRTRTC
ncbi:MAG: serine hydrolase [Streptosporangiaceae bacterium]